MSMPKTPMRSSDDALPTTETPDPLEEAPFPVGPGGKDPALTLPPILNYLRDNDWNRDPMWMHHFKYIQDYVYAAQKERLEGRPGYGSLAVLADLDDALMKIDLHKKYYTQYYAESPWSTARLPVKHYSDRLITYPKLHPRPSPSNDKSLLRHKRLDAPDPPHGYSPFYVPAPPAEGKSQNAVDDVFLSRYRQDQMTFWDALDKHTWESIKQAQRWMPPTNNMFDVANQFYEHCVPRGVTETVFRYKMEPEDPPAEPPTLEPFLKKFARLRGLKRVAIQQALNLFTNHENRSINTPWRRVVLPYEKVAVPKEVPFQPRILPPDRMSRTDKDPFPWVNWYNSYKTYLDHVALRKRTEYNMSNWLEFDRPSMPVNFRGPYVVGGQGPHDDYWMRAGKALIELEAYLKDRYAIYPRSLLKAMLNDIEAGKIYPYKPDMSQTEGHVDKLREMDYYKRRDLIWVDMAMGDHGSPDLPQFKLLDEWEMTWLRFVGETPRSFLMMEKSAELRQDNLALIFDNRLQEVLRAYGSWEEVEEEDALFEDNIPIPVDELLVKINGAEGVMLDEDHLRQPNRAHQFTIEEAEHYIRVLGRLGRCTYVDAMLQF